jgi:hypothetical protein
MKTLKGEFEVTSWDEDAYAQRDGDRKLTHAVVNGTVSGDVTGAGDVQWLMSYQADGTARFVGFQHLDGTIDGRKGSAVVESIGAFDGKEAAGTWTVVPGSGTGDWSGLRGEGSFRSPMGTKAAFTLDYAFE